MKTYLKKYSRRQRILICKLNHKYNIFSLQNNKNVIETSATHKTFNLLLNIKDLYPQSTVPMIVSDFPFKFASINCPQINFKNIRNNENVLDLTNYLDLSDDSFLINIEGLLTMNNVQKIFEIIINASERDFGFYLKYIKICMDPPDSVQDYLDSLLDRQKYRIYKTNDEHQYIYKGSKFFQI